jgi:hypothetical protein
VSVIRDDLRPTMPDEEENNGTDGKAEYRDLLTTCWLRDTTVRPTFLVRHVSAQNNILFFSRRKSLI